MALDKVGFAVTVYGECCSPSVTLGEPFAECFMSFAECFGHSANSRSPVVMGRASPNPDPQQNLIIIRKNCFKIVQYFFESTTGSRSKDMFTLIYIY